MKENEYKCPNCNHTLEVIIYSPLGINKKPKKRMTQREINRMYKEICDRSMNTPFPLSVFEGKQMKGEGK